MCTTTISKVFYFSISIILSLAPSTLYEKTFHMISVITLPNYSLQGLNRYKLDTCDDVGLDALTTHLPRTLNSLLCPNSTCETYVAEPRCYRGRISINTLLTPSNSAKLLSVGLSECDITCRKTVQNKIALLLSKNLKIVLQKPS